MPLTYSSSEIRILIESRTQTLYLFLGGPVCIAHTADHLTPLLDGMVSNVAESSIGLCFDRSQNTNELQLARGTFAILPRFFETTYKRLKQ